MRAEPCVGATKPFKSRIVVVLPAPLGPRKATTCPLGMENETSRTARNDPNCLQSPSASIMTGVDIPAQSSADSGDDDSVPDLPTPTPARLHGAVKGGPADRRVGGPGARRILARDDKARNPHNSLYEGWPNVFIMRRRARRRNRLVLSH